MEDDTFNIKGIHVVNVILNYFYMGLLIMCFLLALGNRPQGSKWGYTTAFVGFALITVYMTFAAFFLAFKGIENLKNDTDGSLSFDDLFTNAIFRNIVLSLVATLGLYIISSLLFVSLLCSGEYLVLTVLVRTLAYDNLFPPIRPDVPVIHLCVKRLCRTSTPRHSIAITD